MKALGYVLIILIKSPIWILQWLLARKMLLVIVVVGVVIVIGSSIYSSKVDPKPEAHPYQKNVPKTIYVVQTPSRYYYVNAYRIEGEYLVLSDFYSYGKEWEKQKIELPLKLSQTNIIKR
jgi:hypothetical protein